LSVRKSLAKLEATGTKDSAELLPQLCRLLGIVDSILWPVRFAADGRIFNAMMNAQREYFESGTSFQLVGSDDQTWKQSERLRGSLVDAGYAESQLGGKLKLTLMGDCVARQLCALPTITNRITAFFIERLGELPTERGDYWISEGTLFQLEDDTDNDAIHTMTEFMQPLIVQRLIETTSSTIARVFYSRLVDALPTVDCPSLEYSPDCSDQYTSAFCQGMRERKTLSYSGSRIWIPLHA
jgi:hypothetical protein